jgi:hypothetical protein
MKRPTLLLAVIYCFILLWSVFLPSAHIHAQGSDEDPIVKWLAQQKTDIEKKLAAYEQGQAKARLALSRAQSALATAQKLDDSESAAIAQKAIATANAALAKWQALIAQAESRLNASQRASNRAALTLLTRVNLASAPIIESEQCGVGTGGRL